MSSSLQYQRPTKPKDVPVWLKFWSFDGRLEDGFALAAVPLLIFMAWWVFIHPASYWVGWWPGYTQRMDELLSQPYMPTPRDTISKYAKYSDVKLTHILPSGVWSLCAAVQLVPRLRATAPSLHRAAGRILLLCSALITLGYILMEVHGLVLQSPAEVDGESERRDERPGGHHTVKLGAVTLPALRALSAWFVVTGCLALHHARGGRMAGHRRWAVRHIASGAWVIVQRMVVLGLAAWAQAAGVAWSDGQRHDVFGGAALVAIPMCLVGTEVYLHLAGLAAVKPGGSGRQVAGALVAIPGDDAGGKKLE